jgi:hypothetical protein
VLKQDEGGYKALLHQASSAICSHVATQVLREGASSLVAAAAQGPANLQVGCLWGGGGGMGTELWVVVVVVGVKKAILGGFFILQGTMWCYGGY